MNSRGSASVSAVLLAVVLLAGAILLYAGTGDERVERRIREAGDASQPVGDRPVGLAQLDEAGVLSQLLHEGVSPARAPAGARFLRTVEATPPPPVPESAIRRLGARTEGLAVVLEWELDGEVPDSGFLVERLGAEGRVLYAERVPADARSYRDEPLDAVRGERTYRIRPVVRDGTVAPAAEKVISFDLEPGIEFLGTGAGGAGRFRLTLGLSAADFTAEFLVPPGEGIGGPRSEAEGGPRGTWPRMDWTSGTEFVEVRGRRAGRALPVPTPEFAPDGRVLRDEETGELYERERTVLVFQVLVFARVRKCGTDEDRWLGTVED